MSLLILGKGQFAEYLDRAFKSNGWVSRIVSARDKTVEDLLSIVSYFNPTYIFDSLDPSSDSINCFSTIANRNILFRDQLTDIPFVGNYYYISSTNIYQASSTIICESSKLLVSGFSPYLSLKSHSEKLVKTKVINSYIFRLPTILFPKPSDPPISFFDDLKDSRKNNFTLKPRDGDKNPFSFIDANLAASGIYNAIKASPSLLNIVSNTWSSRYHLKNSLPYLDTGLLGHRISSLHELLICPTTNFQ